MRELTIDQALKKGVEAHKAGKLKDADRLYTAILRAQPKHPDANHNLGVLAVDVGKVEQALPFFKIALEANPATTQFWLSYIDTLIKLDKLADAQAVLNEARSKGAKGDCFDKLEQRFNETGQEPLEARIITALVSPQQPNILNSLKLDQAISLANKKSKDGFPEEAKHIYQDILIKFPKNKRASDGLRRLMGGHVGNAAKGQEPPQTKIKKLVNLYSQGQLQQALQKAETLVQQFPQSAILFNIQGAALEGLGQLDKSIAAYNKALAIKSDYADAHYNMGIALKKQGRLEEAIEAYNKAIASKPDYADAYYNMGIALEAAVFKQRNPDLHKTIISLIDNKSYVRPSNIVRAVISLLKFEPRLKKHLQSSAVADVGSNMLTIIKDLSALPLLLKLMSVCPLPDLDLEDLFRELRSSLLFSISDLTGSPDELKFQSALALQCFTNEYIYNQTEHEDQAIAALETAIKQALNNNEQPSPQSILCLASYRPLNKYDWSNSLRINDEIADVLITQVTEPNQEAKLKVQLPVLEEISDEISSQVRNQYEARPYPRWIHSGLQLKPAPISELVERIKLKLFDDAIKEVEAPNILIAGCGTGQHAIETATRFKGSKVLAIDLSLSSLSYAKRKTEELRIENIGYMQADILDLGKLNRQFDIVESVGVLHHMNDPVAGWMVLTDCLKPGGLMRIGLYSEAARQHIVEMRQEISKAGLGSSDAAMKSFRKTVKKSDQNHHKRILSSSDFYSLSPLKDLLFHVQEHRFTLSQIQDCLSKLGLGFCGFEADGIVSHFKLNYTGAGDPYDLDKWQEYEEVNPRAFARMYQFWCQKIA